LPVRRLTNEVVEDFAEQDVTTADGQTDSPTAELGDNELADTSVRLTFFLNSG